jgi:hypothetical protein
VTSEVSLLERSRLEHVRRRQYALRRARKPLKLDGFPPPVQRLDVVRIASRLKHGSAGPHLMNATLQQTQAGRRDGLGVARATAMRRHIFCSKPILLENSRIAKLRAGRCSQVMWKAGLLEKQVRNQ